MNERRKHTLDDLRSVLKGDLLEILGSEDVTFTHPCAVDAATPGGLSFCSRKADAAKVLLRETRAAVTLCLPEARGLITEFGTRAFALVEDPRLQFARAARALFPAASLVGVSEKALIHPEARVGRNVYIGPGCVIGRCVIGDEARLLGMNFIFDQVTLGKRVVLKPGAVIGADGLGFARNSEGEWEKVPHFGGVVVEDDVEIGPNACIDRGVLKDTVIRQGTKIDALVHIAHNVVVGRHCIITSGARVAGSSTIGDHVWIAPGATVTDGVSVGDRCWIGLGAMVAASVPSGARVVPVPPKIMI